MINETPNIETTDGQEQLERIAETIAPVSAVTPVRNDYGELLAVKVAGFFEPSELVEVPQMRLDIDSHIDDTKEQHMHFEALETLPMVANRLFPRKFLELLDVIVQAASDRTDVLAANLRSRDSETEPYDFETHIDGGPFDDPREYDVQGIRVHSSFSGLGAARFGQIRSYKTFERAYKSVDTERYLERVCRPFTEPVELGPGDVVIFRGYGRSKPQLLPVAHNFRTIHGPRSRTTHLPKELDRVEVLQRRAEIIDYYDLATFGYEKVAA